MFIFKPCYSINLAWPSSMDSILSQYYNWLSICNKYNIRLIRLFIVPWGIDPFSSNWHKHILFKILEKAEKSNIYVCLVLNTYVNLNYKTIRDFENNEYCWKNYKYNTGKKINHFLKKTNGEYIHDIVEFLKSIYKYQNVKTIELCNEIDLIDGSKHLICEWINRQLECYKYLFSDRYDYCVSISNHHLYKTFSSSVNCRCDIHLYRFPYNTAIENYTYYKSLSDSFLSEFACYSDYSHILEQDSLVYFSACLVIAFLNGDGILPSPWWWEDVLASKLYLDCLYLINIFGFKTCSAIDTDICICIDSSKATNNNDIEKIKDRVRFLAKNPFFIVKEISSIKKYIYKKIYKKYNNNFASKSFFADKDQLIILVESYSDCNFMIDFDCLNIKAKLKKIYNIVGKCDLSSEQELYNYHFSTQESVLCVLVFSILDNNSI